MTQLKKYLLHISLTLFCLSLVSSCSGLKEQNHKFEPAALPTTNGIWSELNFKHDRSYFLPLNNHFEALKWRLRALDSAESSIDLQIFLWNNDHAGKLLANSLVLAADRGVKIRLLIDDTFTIEKDQGLSNIHKHPNIDIRIYNPFKRRYNSFGMRYLMNITEFSRIDHRMHNKVLIVDNHVVILGGRNLGDEYFGLHAETNFRDMELLANGNISPFLSTIFSIYWANPWSFPLEKIIKNDPEKIKPVTPPVSPFFPLNENHAQRITAWKRFKSLATQADYSVLYDLPVDANTENRTDDNFTLDIYKLISEAKKRVDIVSPYFIPTQELDEAIFEAEGRGVEVRILTNSLQSTNHTIAHSFYRKHMRKYVESGADLYEYRAWARDRNLFMFAPVEDKSLALHAKMILIDDDLSLIGSANLDPRSLNINSELGILLKSKTLSRQLRKLLDIDFHLRNSWKVEINQEGNLIWRGHDKTLHQQPRNSRLQLFESWFLGLLPVESKI
ncbi:phospholipase D family protein [Lentisphaera profundi]|uniref:Phospholipase D family protein n=1 Tax=Lentisphaera profundi TaxID=1658616 RepID=A0ABY7VQC4_9BACT|nr:phospholipase D family protein [Lentisphaera profundi]WDE96395.1 phospholipase D family protein [Lentisphaera profundi]